MTDFVKQATNMIEQSTKVSELPYQIRNLVEKYRHKAGTKFLTVNPEHVWEGFSWVDTQEGSQFWLCVNSGRFDQIEKRHLKNL